MAIGAVVGQVPGRNHPLQLLVTTADHDLAEDCDYIEHWYGTLYDAVDSGEALAAGHDVESFNVAYKRAIPHLRDGVPPSEELCDCF